MPTLTQSDHFDGHRFYNLSGRSAGGISALVKWLATRKTNTWPKQMPNKPFPHPEIPMPGEWSVTFINHATFLLQTGTCALLTDPIFSERAGPLPFIGPRRVRRPGIELPNLPRVDFVLLSHNHYDHLDIRALRHLQRENNPLIVTLLGNSKTLRKAGLTNVFELDWWQSVSLDKDVTVVATPAEHFSARTPWDRDRSLWGGFVIESGAFKLFFAGDSAYGTHFAEVQRRFGPMDVSLLPIGAYRPRWFMGAVHMDPAQAVRAHIDLQSRVSLGMHFGTFQLSDEGMDEPIKELAHEINLQASGSGEFTVLDFGESRAFACQAASK